MSFILDALKKAEQERHAQQAPLLESALVAPIARPRMPQETSQPVFLVAAISVATMLALFCGWLMYDRSQQRQALANAALPAPVAESASNELNLEQAAPVAGEPSVDPERLALFNALPPTEQGNNPRAAANLDDLMDAPGAVISAETPATPEATVVITEATAPVVSSRPEIPAPAPAPELPPEQPNFKSLNEMSAAFRATFPALNIDVHFYDDNPLRRFVMINGRKYRETDTLVEGPRILEIGAEGFVVEHQGNKIAISR